MILSRQQLAAAGAATAVLVGACLAAANFVGDGESGGAGPYAATLGVSIALAALLFGWAIPRTERPARAGLVTATFAILSLPVYWSGLPFVLGPAAVVYGLVGRGRGEGRAATAAVVLGALATVAAVGGLAWDVSS